MRKKIISILIVLVFISTFIFVPKIQANAEALTMLNLAGSAYAIGNSLGLNFGFNNADPLQISSFFENKINTWLAGRTLVEAFGGEIIRLYAGKLIVPAIIYNAILDILDYEVQQSQVEPGEPIVIDTWYGYSVGLNNWSNPFNPSTMIGQYYLFDSTPKDVGPSFLFRDAAVEFWFNGSQVGRAPTRETYVNFTLTKFTNKDTFNLMAVNTNNQGWSAFEIPQEYWSEIDDVTISLDNTWDNDPIDVGYQWEGTIDGTSPDTNLDQLMRDIFQDVADINLSVEGEIGVATDRNTPLQDVPWGGLNDLIDNTAQGINQQIQSQTQSITSAQDATTDAVETLTDTISGALDVPESEDLPDFKFDLRELFPFCIPFDIYRLLSSFDATPTAPHVQLPIVIQSIGFNYTLDLDFSSWNPVAQAMRTAELIVYAIGLAWATGKVIKW